MNISEVSQLTGLSIDTLRYYEKIELIKKVECTTGGKRKYDEHNLQHINFINCMKKAGCSLDVIKQYMQLYDLGYETIDQRIELLETQKQILLKTIEDLEQSVNYLDYKITYTKEQAKQ